MTGRSNTGRGQLVLVAAIALTVALVPLGVAYLQLGYHEDVATGQTTEPATEITGTLDRGLHAAVADVPHADWRDRMRTVTALRSRLEPTIDSVETGRLADGHVYEITYNDTRATAWQRRNCPGGPSRQFGECTVVDGVIVQERTGETHVLGIAVDIQITTPEGETELTTVLAIRTT